MGEGGKNAEIKRKQLPLTNHRSFHSILFSPSLIKGGKPIKKIKRGKKERVRQNSSKAADSYNSLRGGGGKPSRTLREIKGACIHHHHHHHHHHCSVSQSSEPRKAVSCGKASLQLGASSTIRVLGVVRLGGAVATIVLQGIVKVHLDIAVARATGTTVVLDGRARVE